jgi:hypothetical protein
MVDSVEQARSVLDMLRQAIAINQDSVFARATMALLLSRWQQFDASFLEEFIQVVPDADEMGDEITQAYFRLFAEQFLKFGLPQVAKQYLYPEALGRRRSMDELPGVWMERAVMHNALGEKSKVGNCLDIARELITDGNSDALKKLADLRVSLGQQVTR